MKWAKIEDKSFYFQLVSVARPHQIWLFWAFWREISILSKFLIMFCSEENKLSINENNFEEYTWVLKDSCRSKAWMYSLNNAVSLSPCISVLIPLKKWPNFSLKESLSLRICFLHSIASSAESWMRCFKKTKLKYFFDLFYFKKACIFYLFYVDDLNIYE